VGGEDQGGCVFCAIVAGEAEASVAFADDRVVAFMDLGAVTPGHVLVVPRLHVFPRFAGDGFRIGADWATRARHLLDEEARHVRQGLSALGFTGADRG
jgi:diadenosine tetraphosphate (Ap4A) HIT family hydrolase